MADQTLDQLPESTTANDADALYVSRDGVDLKIRRGVIVQGRVPESRVISTTAPIVGGGSLNADRTLSLDLSTVNEDLAPDPAADYVLTHDSSANAPRRVRLDRLGVTSGGGGGVTQAAGIGTITVPGSTTVSASVAGDTLALLEGSNIDISTNAAEKSITFSAIGLTPTTRSISAGAGLTGGGDFTANRSLAINISGQSEDTAPDLANDFILTHDSSVGALRKVRLSLLSSTSNVSLPVATGATLGGVRIGSGITVDVNGVISVPTQTPYTLPAATTTTRGGVQIGSGLTISNGILSNPNPVPYVLPPATVTSIGGVKAGQNISIDTDGTISASGGEAGAIDTAFRPEIYGVIRGAGLSTPQRQQNAAALTTCLNAAASARGRVDLGVGLFEIDGTITVANQSNFTVEGDWTTIRQFGTGSVLNFSNCNQIRVSGLMLTYQVAQTTGDDATAVDSYAAALRLNGVNYSHIQDIDVTNAWVGVGVSGGAGSSGNTFTHIRVTMAAGAAWGFLYRVGTGTTLQNVRVGGNGVAVAVQGGFYVGDVQEIYVAQLTAEWMRCQRALAFNTTRGCMISGFLLENITPVPVGGYAGMIHGINTSSIQIAGGLIRGTTLTTTGQTLTDCSIFTGNGGASFTGFNIRVAGTIKVGTVRFSLLGSFSSAPARGLSAVFTQIYLDEDPAAPHRVDELNTATNDVAADGPLLAFNNIVGELTGGLLTFADESLAWYPGYYGRNIRWNSPLTTTRTVTLSQQISGPYVSGTIPSPRTVRGATVRVTRTENATGAGTLVVANHNSSSIVTLSPNQSALFVYDGANWVLIPGSLSSGTGGGSSTVTFASTAEAQLGVSTTLVMSPARTREAMIAYAASNEVTGLEGDVVGFDVNGNAIVAKSTRSVTVPILADESAVAVKTAARKLNWPVDLKLKRIKVYIPYPGTTATTIDIKASGPTFPSATILASPITVPANTASVSVTNLNNWILADGHEVTFDITVAGTAARGLHVTFYGIEVDV